MFISYAGLIILYLTGMCVAFLAFGLKDEINPLRNFEDWIAIILVSISWPLVLVWLGYQQCRCWKMDWQRKHSNDDE